MMRRAGNGKSLAFATPPLLPRPQSMAAATAIDIYCSMLYSVYINELLLLHV